MKKLHLPKLLTHETAQEPGLVEDLQDLDGTYGSLERMVYGHIVSNDMGFESIGDDVMQGLPEQESGIGVFIGGGAVLSLLPELPIEAAVIIDSNTAVFEFNSLVAGLIRKCTQPDDVLTEMESEQTRKKSKVLQDAYDKFKTSHRPDYPLDEFRAEALAYGVFHWSHPNKFPRVQEALERKPIIYVGADVTNFGFAPALSAVLAKYDQSITFANFTNLHEWISPPRTQPLIDCIRDWPLNPQARVLYADHTNDQGVTLQAGWPIMHYARSPGEYFERIQQPEPSTA